MLATYVQAYKILEDYYENVCKSNIEMGKTQKNDEIQKMKLIEKSAEIPAGCQCNQYRTEVLLLQEQLSSNP